MSEIKTAEQRIHKLEGGEGDSFVTVEQALIAERDELRKALADRDAKLAALEKQEPVAEVMLSEGEKIIDASMAFFDISPVGTKLYAAAGAVRSIPKGIRRKLLDELGAELECADGDEWDDAVVTMVENYLAAGAAPNDVLEGHAHAGLLEAFDAYARQSTYNSHPAKPEHFPKSYPWFSAGYSAAGVAPVPDGWQLVPMEPTQEMWKAGFDCVDGTGIKVQKIYKAMLAASPKEPT